VAGGDQLRRPLGRLAWTGLAAWCCLLTAVLLRPIVQSGYGLGHDMVFTPQQPLDAASVGVSTASPRAVPLDALVALAEHVFGGAVVFRLALVIPLLAAGIGTAVALHSCHVLAVLVSVSVAVWNPFVVERLAIGQWALLWAYAALPWIVVAARQHWPTRWALTVVAVALAAITPTGGLIAAGVAVSLLVARPARGRGARRRSVVLVGSLLVLQLPWVVPALLSSALATSDPAAVRAFASRADGGGGVVGSLASGAGIWDADVVPGSRSGHLALLGLLVVAGFAVLGARRLSGLLGRRLLIGLAAASAAGFALAVLASVPGGAALLRWTVSAVPGAGLLRDGQKWVMPLLVLSALLAGAATETLLELVSATPWRVTMATALALLPILVLPDAAATLAPTLRPVQYPSDWSAVRAMTAVGGDVAVVPFAAYRVFSWAPGRPVLDPAPRLLEAPVVVDDRLAVNGRLLAGEDLRARRVGAVLRESTAATTAGVGSTATLPMGLARLGVTWVVVEHGTPGALPDLSALREVRAGQDVSLYRVPGPIESVAASSGRLTVVVGFDILALLVALLGAVNLSRWAMRRRSRQPQAQAG